MSLLNISDLLVASVRFADRDMMSPIKNLSSGLKINDAADDPTGLGMVNKLRSQEYGLLMSIENTMDGISMIQTLEGYMSEFSDMIIRVKDLAIRASADAVLNPLCSDRTKLNMEAQALISEINRLAQTAKFNNQPILQGNYVEDVTADLATETEVSTGATNGGIHSPSWANGSTVVFTAEAADALGNTAPRVFTQGINTNDNTPIVPQFNQITGDPALLLDPDGDLYYDLTGGVNDPRPVDDTYPLNDVTDPDADGDGYRLLVDDDDSDPTETGTGLNALDPDINIPLNAPTYEKDLAAITWENAVTRNFGETTVDRVSVTVNSGAYTVQVFDRDPLSADFNSWVDVANGVGAGVEVEHIFGDEIANSIRVVIDDPVVQATGGNVTVGNALNEIYNVVELNARVDDTPPETYSYAIAGPAQNIDTIELQVTNTVTYSIYADDGTGPVLVDTGTGDGTIQTHNGFGTLVNPTTFYVELDAAGAVSNFDAKDIDNIALGGAVAAATPRTYEYGITGAPQTIDQIDVETSHAHTIYVDGVAVAAGAGGAPQTYMIGATAASQVHVEMADPAGTMTSFNVLNLGVGVGSSNNGLDPRVFNYAFAAADVSHLEVETAAGVNYNVYVDGALKGAGVGGALQTFDFATVAGATEVRVEMDPGGDSGDIVSVAASNIMDQAFGGQATPTRFFRYDVQNNPQNVNHIDLEIANGIDYTIYDDTGATVASGTGIGAPDTEDFGAVSTDYLRVELELGGVAADITSFAATSEVSLGAAATSFADLNDDNENAIVYAFNPPAAPNNGYLKFDQIDYTVELGHDYEIFASDDGGLIWTSVASGTGTGAMQTYTIEGAALTAEIQADTIKIVLASGNDVEGGEAVVNSVINRIDRDGDLFPDSIEVFNGSNPDIAGSLPFGAVAGPDDDNDGFLDYTAYYDTYEVDFLASDNPFNFTWVNGSGNALDVSTGQYPNAGDLVSAAQVPTTADADGDTIPDPLDPFPGQAEFDTWDDGAGAYRGGNVLFVSNRSTPTSGDEDMYLFSGGTYSFQTQAAQPTSNPTMSQDGSAGAWDETDGSVHGFYLPGNCGSAITTFNIPNGTNPTFNNDASKIAMESGGSIIVVTVPDGVQDMEHIIAGGTNPSWVGDVQ